MRSHVQCLVKECGVSMEVMEYALYHTGWNIALAQRLVMIMMEYREGLITPERAVEDATAAEIDPNLDLFCRIFEPGRSMPINDETTNVRRLYDARLRLERSYMKLQAFKKRMPALQIRQEFFLALRSIVALRKADGVQQVAGHFKAAGHLHQDSEVRISDLSATCAEARADYDDAVAVSINALHNVQTGGLVSGNALLDDYFQCKDEKKAGAEDLALAFLALILNTPMEDASASTSNPVKLTIRRVSLGPTLQSVVEIDIDTDKAHCRTSIWGYRARDAVRQISLICTTVPVSVHRLGIVAEVVEMVQRLDMFAVAALDRIASGNRDRKSEEVRNRMRKADAFLRLIDLVAVRRINLPPVSASLSEHTERLRRQHAQAMGSYSGDHTADCEIAELAARLSECGEANDIMDCMEKLHGIPRDEAESALHLMQGNIPALLDLVEKLQDVLEQDSGDIHIRGREIDAEYSQGTWAHRKGLAMRLMSRMEEKCNLKQEASRAAGHGARLRRCEWGVVSVHNAMLHLRGDGDRSRGVFGELWHDLGAHEWLPTIVEHVVRYHRAQKAYRAALSAHHNDFLQRLKSHNIVDTAALIDAMTSCDTLPVHCVVGMYQQSRSRGEQATFSDRDRTALAHSFVRAIQLQDCVLRSGDTCFRLSGLYGSCERTKNVRIHLVGRGQPEINIAWDNDHQFRSKVRYATASCTVFAAMHACCSEHGIDVATALIEMLPLLTDAWGDPCTWTHVRALLLACHTSLAHSHCAAAPPGGSAFERRTA